MRRALTLLETLVTVALLAALTALVMPALMGRLAPMAFDEAARQAQSAIRLAQAEAREKGVPVRITAKRSGPNDPFELIATRIEGDWAQAWEETLNAEPEDDGLFLLGNDLPGPDLPLPDSFVPEPAFGAVSGRLILRLPPRVKVERSSGVEEADEPFPMPPGFEGEPPEPLAARGFEGSTGRTIVVAVLLPDGSAVVAPGAAIVGEDGRRAVFGVEHWTGRVTCAREQPRAGEVVAEDDFGVPEDEGSGGARAADPSETGVQF